MDDYGSAKASPGSPASTTKLPAFAAFTEQFSQRGINSELAMLESLRAIHPDKLVTVVSTRSVSLLSYAKAGHAKAELVTDGDSFSISRDYRPPATRMKHGDGKIRTLTDWAHYTYEWQGHTFPLYTMRWNDGRCGVANDYLLTPRDEPCSSAIQSPLVDQLITACGKWTSAVHDEIYVFDGGHWRKDSELWAGVQSASWDDVILDPEMKQNLIGDVQSFFDNRSVYEEFGVPWKRGIILHGTPGCGKTVSIKALMRTLQERDVAPLYVKSLEGDNGQQFSIRSIFHQARVMAPCLLVFEDLDSLIQDKVRSYFLNEVDGLERNDGILMIGSTNFLDRLDPSISKRPSRFDRKYHFQLPSLHERVLYCQYWRNKLQKRQDLGFTDEVCDIVARLTEDFSFAYLKELFVQALLAVASGRGEDEEEINEAAAVTATENTVGSESAVEADSSTAASAEQDVELPRELPEVEIPALLRENALLKILKKQVATLIKDMDNTGGGHVKPKTATDGVRSGRRVLATSKAE